ncbi:MAG: DndE family protein, partial [Halobacteriovoraceae bacterium]|nr:DndE family protein [Halobacteriovoraceae bacterium]
PMISNRVRISQEASDQIKQIKQKVKAGPKYTVARMGFVLSLNDPRPPQGEFYLEDGDEFNRGVLLGDYDPIFLGMLLERGLYKKPKAGEKSQKVDELTHKQMTSYLVAHINRGVMRLFNKVKNQEDLFNLIKEQRA